MCPRYVGELVPLKVASRYLYFIRADVQSRNSNKQWTLWIQQRKQMIGACRARVLEESPGGRGSFETGQHGEPCTTHAS